MEDIGMAINWEDIRYRGDDEAVKELYETYKVENYLVAFEDNLKQQNRGMRERLLKHGIRLTEKLSPRIFGLFKDVCIALEIESEAEIFCLPDPGINAFAMVDTTKKGTRSLIGLTSGALEQLDDGEIRAILGHELGHFLFNHNRLNALLTMDENNPAMTVLPPFGESLFLRWRKKAEISADRAGLLASKDFHATARSLLKATFGLSEKNLNLEIDALAEQIDEITGSAEMVEEAFSTHPLLPIRLKALELFWNSERATRNNCKGGSKSLSDEELESHVDELIALTRRHPTTPLSVAVMEMIAYGGALMLSRDGDIGDDEIKLLIQMLHEMFTDDPESVMITDMKEIDKRLHEVAAVIKEEGGEGDKAFLLARFAEIALADGALMDEEGKVITALAGMLDVSPEKAYGIIVSTAQSEGFKRDVKLNTLAAKMKDDLLKGRR